MARNASPIPGSVSVNFFLQFAGQVGAQFGCNFATDQTFTTDAAIRSSAGFPRLEILSPGGTYTSASGTNYTATRPAVGAPDSTSVASLLAPACGAVALGARRKLSLPQERGVRLVPDEANGPSADRPAYPIRHYAHGSCRTIGARECRDSVPP